MEQGGGGDHQHTAGLGQDLGQRLVEQDAEYLIPLVEVVRGEATAEEVVGRMMDLLAGVGKTPVHIRRDVPGFVGNRLQHALWREAIAIVAAGICDAETVDTVVKQSFGRRLDVLGPLENADLVGLDLTMAIHEYVLPHLDRTPSASPLLRDKVARGELGIEDRRRLPPLAPRHPRRPPRPPPRVPGRTDQTTENALIGSALVDCSRSPGRHAISEPRRRWRRPYAQQCH